METGFIERLINVIPEIHTPYMTMAYISILILISYWVKKLYNNESIRSSLKKLPENERTRVLRETINTPIPENVTAQEWLQEKKHKYLFYIFLSIILSITLILIYSKDSQTIKENKKIDRQLPHEAKNEENIYEKLPLTNYQQYLEIEADRGYLREKFGMALKKSKFSTNNQIEMEYYPYSNSEMILLYKQDNLEGYLLRNFDGDRPTLKIELPSNIGIFGESSFEDLGVEQVQEREPIGRFFCFTEKQYYGRPGGYLDYFFTYEGMPDENESPQSRLKLIPNSMLVISPNICASEEDPLEESRECLDELKQLSCEYFGSY